MGVDAETVAMRGQGYRHLKHLRSKPDKAVLGEGYTTAVLKLCAFLFLFLRLFIYLWRARDGTWPLSPPDPLVLRRLRWSFGGMEGYIFGFTVEVRSPWVISGGLL